MRTLRLFKNYLQEGIVRRVKKDSQTPQKNPPKTPQKDFIKDTERSIRGKAPDSGCSLGLDYGEGRS